MQKICYNVLYIDWREENRIVEKKGRYGEFGGQYAAETLMNALINLEEAFNKYKDD